MFNALLNDDENDDVDDDGYVFVCVCECVQKLIEILSS